jgi:hypothetical protein
MTTQRHLLHTRLRPVWLLLALTIAVPGCIDTFDAGRASGGEYLVVDAAFDNTPRGRSLRLGLASQPFNNPRTAPVPNAVVQVQAVGGSVVRLSAVGGLYSLPLDFQFRPGTTYKLLIRLADGRQYESGPETAPATVPIRKLYRQFDPLGYQISLTGNTFLPAQNLLVDFDDPADQTNFYQWTYVAWERQTTCITCDNSIYDNGTNKCIPPQTNTVFDYGCQGDCWQIVRNGTINVTGDALFNGRSLTGRLAGVLPYYTAGPMLVAVQQRNLSVGAFRYALILADQSQNTGGLADTPPAGLGGNVRNVTDAAETVLGYFSVSGVSEILYWNDRAEVPPTTVPIGFLGGRKFSAEPAEKYGILRPPLAPCVLSDSRTPVKPVGWQN